MANAKQSRAGRGRSRTKGTTFAVKDPRPIPLPDPTGRADIALTRILGLAVKAYVPNPVLQIAFEQATPLIQMGMTALAGPKTQTGKTSMLAVAMIREVKARLDEAERTVPPISPPFPRSAV